MLLENQNIDIKVTNTTEEDFQKLGYKVKNGDRINVPIEHLTRRQWIENLSYL